MIVNKGVYLVEYKFGLFLFKNPSLKVEEYLNRDDMYKLLRQNFVEDKVNLIINKLEDSEKLLIDFNKHSVSIINSKRKKFESIFLETYFDVGNLSEIIKEEGGEN